MPIQEVVKRHPLTSTKVHHRAKNKQFSTLRCTKTGSTQPKLSAACFVVQSCLADADFVVFSNYCLIGTRPMTVVYCQVGETGYLVYVDRGTAFKVKKNGETTNVKWTDGSGNEFTGTISYHDDSFTLTYKTNSPDSAIKECTGADLYLKDSDSTDTSSSISTPSTTESTTTGSAVDLTPYNIWEAFVTNEWVDEEGNRLKFTQNITYYKLKPNAIHTDSDYYMGTLSTTNSKGYYYGHYHIDDDYKLRFQFNSWPNGDIGLLLNDSYVWDPTLKEQNSWCMTSDGKIQFSQGNNEFSGKTYHH